MNYAGLTREDKPALEAAKANGFKRHVIEIDETHCAVYDIDTALSQIAEMEREKSGCDFCNGKSDEHGFFIDGNVLYYRDGQLGTEGIVINKCPMCGKNLKAEG